MKEVLNLKYWNNYYKKKDLVAKPTKFAIFCKKKLKKYKGVVFDIGCGNGRDSVYFNKSKIFCIGIDKSLRAISKSKKKFSFYRNNFKKRNFCNFFEKPIKNERFSVYSRFSLHSINYKNEKKLLSSLSNQKNLEYLLIESRTLKDDLYNKGIKVGKHEFVWNEKSEKKKFISSHYRRFIDPNLLRKKLKNKFKILYFKQSKGFAKFKKEDPCVLRVIAKKK